MLRRVSLCAVEPRRNAPIPRNTWVGTADQNGRRLGLELRASLHIASDKARNVGAIDPHIGQQPVIELVQAVDAVQDGHAVFEPADKILKHPVSPSLVQSVPDVESRG
jgi:hypothetical protein